MKMLTPINEHEDFDEQGIYHENRRSVIIDDSQPLARVSALYVGTIIPKPDQYGIDSVQESLLKLYPVHENENVQGLEVWLTVDANGLNIQFVRDPSFIIYYPIRSMIYCDGLRLLEGTSFDGQQFERERKFSSLNSYDNSQIDNNSNPPLFTIIFQRTRDLPLNNECFCFIMKTKQSAMSLVTACYRALYQTDEQQDCSSVPFYFKINKDDDKVIEEANDDIKRVPQNASEKNLDYQNKHEYSGYFYKTDSISIEKWELWEHAKNEIHRSSSGQSVNSNSSRKSHRKRRLASVTSIPDMFKVSEERIASPSPSKIDPYAPEPNVIRVERIIDPNTGREVFIRWIDDAPSSPTSDIPQQTTSSSPNAPYDFHIDFDTNQERENALLKILENLSLYEKASKKSKKKSKKKHRKHKHHKHHSPPTIFPEQYPIPPMNTAYYSYNTSYTTSPLHMNYFQSNIPYWYQ